MTVGLLTVAGLAAAVSAVPGVWSPCGLLMLSVTPMSESGRGNRFRVATDRVSTRTTRALSS